MKILYFLDQSKALGGAAVAILRQAILMKRNGADVRVVYSDYPDFTVGSAFIRFCEAEGIPGMISSVCASSQPEDISVCSLFDNYDDVFRIVSEFKPDILHSMQLNPVVELVGRELEIPHVMNIYPALDDFFRIKWFDIFPHYHICDSEYWAKVWHDNWGTDSVCIRTVVDFGPASVKKTGGSLSFICVGIVNDGKNQLSVLEAFYKYISDPANGDAEGATLRLYGHYGGSYSQKCIDYAKEHFDRSRVSFEGFRSDMSSIYANADILIVGSTRESYPNVVSEALANNVIVISTPVGGVPEVIKDGYNGYIAGGFEPDDILEAIKRCVSDIRSGSAESVRQNAYMTYEKTHSPKSVTAELEKYYGHVIEDFKAPKSSKIKIEEVKAFLEPVLQQYEAARFDFSDPASVEIKLWLIRHLQLISGEWIRQGRKVYIWGAGRYGTKVHEMVKVFLPAIELAGFIDSQKTGHKEDLPVFLPGDVLGDQNKNSATPVVLFAVNLFYGEALSQLKAFGMKGNEDYFIMCRRAW